MKRSNDQVELAGALTSLRSLDGSSRSNSTDSRGNGRFTAPAIEEHHASWTAWTKYLDGYCHSTNVRIGVEFTDSVQKRNDEMQRSKRAKTGKFMRLLPEELDAYRRSYVCHLGRKGRTRDIKFRRTACPFKLVAKSVFNGGKWEVEVSCPNAEHIHTETASDSAAPASVEAQDASQTQAFPVDGLKGKPPSRKVLTDMTARCRRIPESKKLCSRLRQRLDALHNSVAPLDKKDPMKVKYVDVVVRLVKLMRCKPLLMRLASSETLVYKIRELQLKLDGVVRGLEVTGTTEVMEWSEHWDSDRADQNDMLVQLVSSASERMLINEFRGDGNMIEALLTLNGSMSWKGQSSQMVDLKKRTSDRISAILQPTGLRTCDWFISIHDLEYEDKIINHSGTFGEAKRSTWLRGGERTNVVVKWLYKEVESYSDDVFRRELEQWHNLPMHKHILKLYGGSHVNRPQFYVCEYAENGHLRGFVGKENNRSRMWRMFGQAAQGLKILHDNGLAHGALKCDNILVGADDTVKLADFGFRSVRALTASLSGDAEEEIEKSVHWKAKELLDGNTDEKLQYAADIYALGACMIEALMQQDPFGDVKGGQVVNAVRQGEGYQQPDGILDDEWTLIERMCEADYTLRPTLDKVLEQIGGLAAKESLFSVSRAAD